MQGKWLRIMLPTLIIVFLLIVWEAITEWLDLLPYYILPSPIQTLSALLSERATISRNLVVTLFEASVGFVAGTIIAFISAAVFVAIRGIRYGCLPLAIIGQTIPLIVYVPFLGVVMGYGAEPKIAIAVIISYFPALIYLVRGFEAVNPLELDLFATLDASWWDVFWRLRVPSSMPFLFASLKITSTLAVLGAMVGEYMSGSSSGIGYLILTYNNGYRVDRLLAAVLAAASMSIMFYALIAFLESRMVKWAET